MEISTYVNVDLEEFPTEDIVEYLRDNGYRVDDDGDDRLSAIEQSEYVRELVTDIYYKRRLGREYQQDLNQLIYTVLKKLV